MNGATHLADSGIDHVSVGSDDLRRARAFYDPVLQHLGLPLIEATPTAADYGKTGPVFSIETPVDGRAASPGNGLHIAFKAADRRAVDEFHALALRCGGRDAGTPGLRPDYGTHYYSAFVVDPDGNKIEAVTYADR